jgi:hypothetical protein
MDPATFKLVTGLVFPRAFMEFIAMPPPDLDSLTDGWSETVFFSGGQGFYVAPPRRADRTLPSLHPERFGPLYSLTPVTTPRHTKARDDRKTLGRGNTVKKARAKKDRKLVVGGNVVKYN